VVTSLEFLHVFSCVYLCHSKPSVHSVHVPGMFEVGFLRP
jgi:hypothetical protein